MPYPETVSLEQFEAMRAVLWRMVNALTNVLEHLPMARKPDYVVERELETMRERSQGNPELEAAEPRISAMLKAVVEARAALRQVADINASE